MIATSFQKKDITGKGMMKTIWPGGMRPIWVDLPQHLATLPPATFRQVQLVYHHATKRSCWHITIDDGSVPHPTTHTGIMAMDLGEIHPAGDG